MRERPSIDADGSLVVTDGPGSVGKPPRRHLPRNVLLVVMALAAAIWAVVAFSPVLSIELTPAQIQAQLDPRFPAEKCALATLCLELREPQLRLTEGSDRLGLSVAFAATLRQRRMPGTATFTGRPRYDYGSASFHLDDVRVTDFQMSGNAPDFNEVVRVRGPGVMAGILQDVPLYTLRPDSVQAVLARFALRSVSVVDGKLRITVLNPLGLFGPP